MVLAVFVIIAVVTVAVGLSTLISYWLNRGESELEKLGVSRTYPRSTLPGAKIDAYFELKERLREQYAKGSDQDRAWMSQLPMQAKDMLKYRLMQRAIGDMAALRKIDADARGYWRLFSKGMITRTFWNSVMEAEQDLTQELESVKLEASCVEPSQDPQGIISEAMQFVMRYGDKLASTAEMDPSTDAITEMMRHLPPPGAAAGGGAGGGPPGAPGPQHGGHPQQMMQQHPNHPRPPPGMGGPHPGAPMPPQKGGSEEDGYLWKQDADELEVSVIVPDTATKAQVKVTFGAKKLRVEHAGTVLVEGQLAAACVPEGSTWTLSKGRLVVSLEKADPRPWPGLFAAKG
mmetsp:Transcript_133453/g.333143  ORF Transcript_133453/g.333143 Transcript_133453/m.333143 type:complete len:346 (-) Transcript_133453:52-1089(-)